MSIDIQGDFNNYFDMVETKAVGSSFYTDIKKFFEEGKIDAKTYVSAMTSFHADTLKEAVNIARDMSIGVRELELKVNESVADVNFKNTQREAIGTELAIKQADSTSRIALDNARIGEIITNASIRQSELQIRQSELQIRQSELQIRQSELQIHQADSTSRIALDNARIGEIGTNASIRQSELQIHQADSTSRIALDGARISDMYAKTAIQQADSSSRIALDNARISDMSARISIQQADSASMSALRARQITGFDDNKQIKQEEHKAQVYAMVAGVTGEAGGGF